MCEEYDDQIGYCGRLCVTSESHTPQIRCLKVGKFRFGG